MAGTAGAAEGWEALHAEAPVAMFLVDGEGVLRAANQAARRLFGWPDEAWRGTVCRERVGCRRETCRCRREAAGGRPFPATWGSGQAADPVLAVPVGHGGEFCAVTVLGAGYAALDALTGLGNRHALTRRRETGWGAAGGAALLLDLDGMKEINDLWGHAAGDAVLAHTARVLASSVGSSDLALRWGGDEFAVFLPGAGRQRAMALREEIRRRLERRGELPAEYPLGVSCGIGLWNPGEDPAAAVRRADPELYRKPARKPTHFMGGMKRPPCVFQP